jgi:hypothetical protein
MALHDGYRRMENPRKKVVNMLPPTSDLPVCS